MKKLLWEWPLQATSATCSYFASDGFENFFSASDPFEAAALIDIKSETETDMLLFMPVLKAFILEMSTVVLEMFSINLSLLVPVLK